MSAMVKNQNIVVSFKSSPGLVTHDHCIPALFPFDLQVRLECRPVSDGLLDLRVGRSLLCLGLSLQQRKSGPYFERLKT